MSSKVGIKVPVDSSVVKVVKTVKDIEPLPISEIKRRLNDSDYLLTYNLSSEDGVNNIIKCYKKLVRQGIQPILFEHDRETGIEFLCNLSRTYQEISAEIDEEMDLEDSGEDNDKIFGYQLSDAWRFPIVSVKVFDRAEDNVKCMVWYATHAPADLALTRKFTLSEDAIGQIMDIISKNEAVFDIDEVEFPCMLDGFGNEFFFRNGNKTISLDASNIAAWKRKGCKKTIDGNDPVNAKLLLKMFSKIKVVLTDNGVDGRYLSLVSW
jgi:hypothetical protein